VAADDIVSLGGPERPDRVWTITAWAAGVITARARVIAVAAAATLVIVLAVTAAVLASSPGAVRRSGHPDQVAVIRAVDVIPIRGGTAVAKNGAVFWAVRYVRLPAVRLVLVKIDAQTGKIRQAIRLPAGRCESPKVSGGRLVVECSVGSRTAEFVRVNLKTGAVIWRPVRHRRVA
jgi:hypothetical protein